MKIRLFLIAVVLTSAFFLCGCFGILTSPPSANPRANKVTGSGLGPNVPTVIWTDGEAVGSRPVISIKSDTYVNLVEKINPAVVNIFTSQKLDAGIGIGLFAIPLPNLDLHAQSLGTGFIISPDGFVLTNYHVIKYADEISVFLHETNEVQPIEVIGVDPMTDVALLKIKTTKPLPYLPLADSDAVSIGEPVIAVGNPFGLAHSLTTGVVSAKNRNLKPGTRSGNAVLYLQTSAQINPGNSGGPLLNLYGEVIGINTAIIAKAQGIGFAIPSNLIKQLAPDLVRSGSVERGYIGIAAIDLTPVLAKRFKVETQKGVMITRIDRESPATQAGLQKGDIVLSMDGVKPENAHEFARSISLLPPGKKVKIEVMRNGGKETFIVQTWAL